MSHVQVEHCFDSHVHWQATGQQATRLLLHDLDSPEAIRSVKIQTSYFQNEWLVGFGWDNNKWPRGEFPHRQILDELFPDYPVSLSRADGHAAWVNSKALQKIDVLDERGQVKHVPQMNGGKVVMDANGQPTGVLIDLAKSLVDRLIPEPDAPKVRSSLLKGVQIFNQAGFTHIRDMSCSELQFNETCHLFEAGLLTLAVEQYFSADDPKDFDQALSLAKAARNEAIPLVRVEGLKIYYDGALGSEGALISKEYASGSGFGLELLEKKQLQDYLNRSWESGFDLAIHTLGDEAAHRVLLAAEELWNVGKKGQLHLEHAQMLRPETIRKMLGRTVTCHLQPCHWLSDRYWLNEKLGDLTQHLFPWRALQESGVAFDFGSDSPVEKPSLYNNLLALEESTAQGIPPLLGSPFSYHSHPDKSWVPNTYTRFQEGQPVAVVFKGIHLV